MPKRKGLPQIPDYIGSGENSETLLIQKSNPLLTLSETSMTLPEFKILDAYLARINSHEPDKRYVRFEKGELEKLLGVTRMHRKELSKRVKNLFQAVEVLDERKPNGFICISLFSKAECWQDEDGLWQINLACSEEAMEYIFNIENLGYLKYRLRNVINLTSRYSYILYLFIEDNSYRKKWEINLEELKKILNCTSETYNEYKRFNDLILKKCQKEINEKTTISFTYTPVRKSRKVVGIKFEVEKNPQIEITPDIAPEASMSEVPVSESVSKVQRFDIPEFVSSKSVPDERPEPQPQRQTGGTFDTDFTPEQVRLLCDILAPKLLERDRTPERIESNLRGLYSKMRLSYNYIGNPLSLLLKFIDNLETPKETKKPKKTKKSNFNEDMYDIFVNDFETINREI